MSKHSHELAREEEQSSSSTEYQILRGWKVDLLPLRINPESVLELHCDSVLRHESLLSQIGKYQSYRIDLSDLSGEKRKLPFPDKSLGFVWVTNVLERLEAHKRRCLVNEIARISNKACIIIELDQGSSRKHNHGLGFALPNGMRVHHVRDGSAVICYNLPLIAVIGDNKKQPGGANAVIENIKLSIRQLGFSAYETYVTSNLGGRLSEKIAVALWPFFMIKTLRQEVSDFDMIVTVHPMSHYLKHSKHLVYFLHHQRAYYDLYGFFMKQFNILGKLGLGLMTGPVRFFDKKYLVPNLSRSKVIVLSKNVAGRLMAYNKICGSKVVYPGGYIANATRELPNHKKPVALSISRFDITKGIDLIIDAARCLSEVDFVIAGNYGGKRRIDETKLPPNVKLKVVTEQLTEDEKHFLYSSCNIFLAPYINEDLGITPIEANSFGRPVVFCVDSGGLFETQKHLITGYMTQRDPISFAEGIKYCISHAEEMEEKCVESAKRFTWEHFRTEIVSAIKELIGVEDHEF